MEIVLTYETSDQSWSAWFAEYQDYRGYGCSKEEAVSSLILCHGHRFGFKFQTCINTKI